MRNRFRQICLNGLFIMTLFFSCRDNERHYKQIDINEIFQVATRNEPDNDTVISKKGFVSLGIGDSVKTFSRGITQIDGDSYPLETIDVYMHRVFAKYITRDKKRYNDLVDQLKNKLDYKTEEKDRYGRSWQIYRRDLLWSATTLIKDGENVMYIIFAGKDTGSIAVSKFQ